MAKTAVEKREALIGRANVALTKAAERNTKAASRAEKANASIQAVNDRAAAAKANLDRAQAHLEWVSAMPVEGAASAFDEDEANGGEQEVTADEGNEEDFAIV